jgi:hypothetical protein
VFKICIASKVKRGEYDVLELPTEELIEGELGDEDEVFGEILDTSEDQVDGNVDLS